MALINCPECGKENVSDSAIACPYCGFNIREYIEREKETQYEPYELSGVFYDDDRIERMEKIWGAFHIVKIVSIILSVICVITAFLISSVAPAVSFVCAIILAISLISLLVSLFTCWKLEKEILNHSREYAKTYAKQQNELMRRETELQLIQHPKCPNCGGRNTARISTANRVVSVATIGLASSKIGKQYQCYDCKHKW